MLNLSVTWNCFRMEKSHVWRFGPVTIPAPLLPLRVSGAGPKAAGLIQPFGPGSERRTWSSQIISTTSANQGIRGDCEWSTGLIAGNSANFPTRQDCPLYTFQVAEEGQPVVVSRDKNLSSIERSQAIV